MSKSPVLSPGAGRESASTSSFPLQCRRPGRVKLLSLGMAALGAAVVGTACQAVGGTLFPASTVPAAPAVSDSRAVEVGVRFTSSVPAAVTSIRFYKGTGNTGTHTGHIWSGSGQLLATATFVNESGSGWQQATLSPVLAVAGGTEYVVSYHTDVGHYADDLGGLSGGLTSGFLRVPANGGVYAYGAQSTFPNQSYQGGNYYVDLTAVGFGGGPTPPPTPTPTVPPTQSPPPPPTPTPGPPPPTGACGAGGAAAAPGVCNPPPSDGVVNGHHTRPDDPLNPNRAGIPADLTDSCNPICTKAGSPDYAHLKPISATDFVNLIWGSTNLVVSGYDVSGCGVRFLATNLTIRNTRINAGNCGNPIDGPVWDVTTGNLTLIHDELSGGDQSQCIGPDNRPQFIYYTDVHSCASAIRIASGSTLVGNWCHELLNPGHATCASTKGSDNVTIIGNYLADAGGSASLELGEEFGAVINIWVAGNWFLRHTNYVDYTVYPAPGRCSASLPVKVCSPPGPQVTFTGNRVEKGGSGYYAIGDATMWQHGCNVDAVTNAPLDSCAGLVVGG